MLPLLPDSNVPISARCLLPVDLLRRVGSPYFLHDFLFQVEVQINFLSVDPRGASSLVEMREVSVFRIGDLLDLLSLDVRDVSFNKVDLETLKLSIWD